MQRAPNSAYYESMVWAISRRALTYESDIHRASLGLFNVLAFEMLENFLCGLPMHKLLEHFAMWVPVGELKRRGPNASGHMFPSWSWMGWVGPVWLRTLKHFGPDVRGIIEKDFDDVGSIGEVKILLPSSKDEWVESPLLSEDWGPRGLLSVETCRLRFTAPAAHLSIIDLNVGLPDDFTELVPSAFSSGREIPRSLIFGLQAQETYAGEVYVDSAFREYLVKRLKEEEAVTASFIELSRTDVNWIRYGLSAIGRDGRDQFPKGKDGSSILPDCCNVLLVEWEDGVAYIRGVGQVHAQQWDKIDSERRQVDLG
jgi:hypothetical protein